MYSSFAGTGELSLAPSTADGRCSSRASEFPRDQSGGGEEQKDARRQLVSIGEVEERVRRNEEDVAHGHGEGVAQVPGLQDLRLPGRARKGAREFCLCVCVATLQCQKMRSHNILLPFPLENWAFTIT